MKEMPTASDIESLFARRLKLVRKAKGFDKARDAALQMGVAENTYTTWERGDKHPRSWHLVLIKRFFGVPIDYLLDGDESFLPVSVLREIKKLER